MRKPFFRSAAVLLLVNIGGSSQQPSKNSPGQKSTTPAPAQSKQPFSIFPTLVLPEQQKQFCSAFQEDDRRHKEFDEKVKAAGTNPVARTLAQQSGPDFQGLLEAQLGGLMGNGAFRDWVGYLDLSVDRNIASIKIGFPCSWSSPTIFGPRIKKDTLYIGNGFTSTGVDSGGVSIASSAGKALAVFEQGEVVTVSGKLFCSTEPQYVQPAAGVPRELHAGCENAGRDAPGLFWAKFSSLRSVKTGSVARLGDDPPASDSNRITTLTKSDITFYRSDSLEVLKEKSRALMTQKPSAESKKLMEYLQQATCIACSRPNTLAGVSLTAYELDRDSQPQTVLHPCTVAGVSQPNCADTIQVFVEGDLPSWVMTEGSEGPYVPGPIRGCYLVGNQDAESLKQRTQQINGLLRPLGKVLEQNSALTKVSSKPCEQLNSAAGRQREQTVALNNVSAAIDAVKATVTVDEFESRVREAVKNRAVKLGADSSQYETAIKMVGELVRLCSTMSETDFVGPMDQNGRPYLAQSEKYGQCAPTPGVMRSIPAAKEQLGLMILTGFSGTALWERPSELAGFYVSRMQVQVYLKPSPKDPPPSADIKDARQQYIRYIALAATVNIPRRPLASPKYLCPGVRVRPVPGSTASDAETVLSAPTRMRWIDVNGIDASVQVRLEGRTGNYQYPPADQAKGSCAAR